jgi:hypothetical protein
MFSAEAVTPEEGVGVTEGASEVEGGTRMYGEVAVRGEGEEGVGGGRLIGCMNIVGLIVAEDELESLEALLTLLVLRDAEGREDDTLFREEENENLGELETALEKKV